MSLPRIASPSPVVVPATSEKTYPDAYQVMLSLDTPPDKPWTAIIDTLPYNYDTGELHVTGERRRHLYTNLRELAATRHAAGKPALLNAITAVAAAVAELLSEE